MPDSSCKIPRHSAPRTRCLITRQIAVVLSCLLSLAFQHSPKTAAPSVMPPQDVSSDSPRPPQNPDPGIPPDIQQQLQHYRDADDLTGWIYYQIQWVAKAPAARASLLVQATEKAWRIPHSNEEIQSWQDLLINEGYALLVSGDIVRSTDAYTAAFQWARQHKELTDATLVLENILKPLGNNYTRLGDYEQALFIQDKALATAGSLGDKDALAGAYSNLANTSSNMGLPQQSLDYCRQGLEAADPHSALYGLLLSEQADAYAQLQQDKASRESIRKSIAVLEQVAAAGHTASNAGYWLLTAYQQAGDIYSEESGPSLQFYTKALRLQTSLWQQHGAIHKREKAKLFQRLGARYLHSGQPAQARYWLNQCLSVLIPGKTADSLQEKDLFAENTLLDLLFTLAGLRQSQNHSDEALQLYTLCFATEKKLRQELITGSAKERSVSDSRLRYETAIRTAWEAWEKTGQQKYQQLILGFMESSKSQLLLEEVQQQAYQRGRGASDEAGTAAPGRGETSGDSLLDRIRLLERALVYYRKEALQNTDNDSLSRLKTKQQKQTEWDLAELRKKLGTADAMSPSGLSAINATTATRTVGASDRSQASSITSPSASNEAFGSAMAISDYTFLRDGQVARSFFTGTSDIYIVECSCSGISFTERLPLGSWWQDSVRTFIHTYFENGANAMIDHPEEYYRQAYNIYRQLFGSHPPTAGNEYILLPDGPLSRLPVEALVTTPPGGPSGNPTALSSPEKWPFLVRQYFISYAWSLQTLQEQVLAPRNGKGVAGFFLSGQQDHGKSPLLAAVLHEKETIANILPSGSWYLDEQATTAAFRKALQESALVHISSHAFTKKDTRDAPHIELFDQPFYLFELQGWEHHPSLVVLNACRTGDGRMVTGEGVQSLARAFTAGGANAVIAGWWNVNDEAAAQLMQGFYSALCTGGSSAAWALHQSKLSWLDAPDISYVHKLPYYWAALNYQGNPFPLPAGSLTESDGRRHSFPQWWWSILPILAALFIWFRRRRLRQLLP